MMRKYLALFILLVACTCFGQNKHSLTHEPTFGNVIHYNVTQNSTINTVSLVIDEATEYISAFNYSLKSGADNFVLLKGSKQIELSVTIPKDSIKYYRYSLIENDTVVVKDNVILDKIDFIYPKNSDLPGKVVVNLGSIKMYNKKIRLELYKMPNKFKVTSVIIYNKPIVPLEISTVTLAKFYNKKNSLDTLNSGDQVYLNQEDNIKKYLLVTPKYNDLSFLYKIKVYQSSKVVYNENLIDYFPTDVALPLEWVNKLNSNYEIRIELDGFFIDYKDKSKKKSMLEDTYGATFPIRISQEKKITAKEVSILIGIIVCALAIIVTLVIIYIKRKSKRKLLAEKQQKEIAKTQLSVVRSQLNPHFMFNALAGIQSLMNEHKMDEANQYLGKFARLTRNVLDNKELISLAEEQTLLDDYLQMEQLRFGFGYQINIQADVDLNVEIPVMLLQPFVENAVKHGIAEKGRLGEIRINFAKENTDLILQVVDNGSGFDTTKTYDGLGLALSKNRIKLLNSIYKETDLVLEMQSAQNGTTVSITLKQWL